MRMAKSKKKSGRLTILALALAMLALPAITGGPALGAPPVGPDKLADFEVGFPDGWFTYAGGSTVTATLLTVSDADPLARPAQSGDNGLVGADFNVLDFGGFGASFAPEPQDWSNAEGFSFWFYGTGSGLAYQAEISDNRSDPNNDTSERFDYVFMDDTVGWQRIFIPWADFTRATDFQPGGAPDDGFTLTEIWAWAIVLPLGADTVYFDDFGVENRIVADFEGFTPGPLPSGEEAASGVTVGYSTFADPDSEVAIAAQSTPPAPTSFEFGEPNGVIQVDLDVAAFAGFIHNFSNETLDAWVPQDWTAYEGLALWVYGQNTGTSMFVDILDNLNPEADPGDTAERWTVAFTDDFSGWSYFEFPFSDFVRKNIDNGAPNDGLTLNQVHGWAFGTVGTPGPVTYYVDNAGLYGVAEIPELAVTFAAANYDIEEGTTGDVAVKLNRPMGTEDPAQVSVDYYTEPGLATPGRDYTPASGTLTFVNGGPSELAFQLETLDDTKWEGDERVILRLTNPVDVAAGFAMQAAATIKDDDPYDPLLLDDFEEYPYLWDANDNVVLENPEVAAGDPNELPGQGAFERVLSAELLSPENVDVQGRICNQGRGVIPVVLKSTVDFDATTVDHTTVSLGDAYETHVDKKTGIAKRHEEDVNGDGLMDLVFHFRFEDTGLPCDPDVVPFSGLTFDGQPVTGSFWRDFPIGQDWSLSNGLKFWYYGTNSGDEIKLTLKDNRAPDPGPSGWNLVWGEEYNEPAGTPPNPEYWSYEIGDGTVNGIPGWGNDEFQYYTDDPANAATDGNGNMVFTLREADGSLLCYYGPCEYTSARLVSSRKAEFAYGRIESRILVPDGEAGLWPAFWSLGTDIDRVGWPQTGEIDFMEYVSKLPNEIFGTIHGPGYSGGQSFGNVYDFGEPVYNDYHTFAIEWQPDLIEWYVDGYLYHTATPADVAPNEWVFNDPVFLIYNMAIGGNFGGAIDPGLQLPQSMAIDYVRVYQGPDTAERWEATFIDDFSGWQEVEVPFVSLTRSADQPAGAPDDGLGLTDVWGYGFGVDDLNASGTLLIDQVRLIAPQQVTVTNTNNDGPGSLRQAVGVVASGGTIDFAAGLAEETIVLTSGPLTIDKAVSIDGSTAPGIAVSGGGTDRVLIVDGGATADISDVVLTNGYGFQLAGCVLNNGTLTLDHVTVTGCTMATDAGDFWQGGGGIYNGDGATLNLVDSSVYDNQAAWSGGGIYSFRNTTTNIERSTISGNVSNDVGGALRLLGDATIVNSTISGNTSTGWHGGAIFQTDGDVTIVNSTVANNVAPDYASSTFFIGQFGGGFVPTLTLTNTIITGNQWYACEKFASGTTGNVVSGGHNVVQDDSCNPVASDVIEGDALIGPLADNGGPTETHALLAGSPAIDAADSAACPSIDQRGYLRDAACDAGSFELGAVIP